MYAVYTDRLVLARIGRTSWIPRKLRNRNRNLKENRDNFSRFLFLFCEKEAIVICSLFIPEEKEFL